jgi:hypothetical protein
LPVWALVGVNQKHVRGAVEGQVEAKAEVRRILKEGVTPRHPYRVEERS